MDVPGAKKFGDYQNAIFKASLEKISGIPISPSGNKYVLNLALLGQKDVKATDVISDTENVKIFTKDLLSQYRSAITERKQQLGRTPASLKEVFYTDLNTPEPSGGTWIYKPDTGEIHSSIYPDL